MTRADGAWITDARGSAFVDAATTALQRAAIAGASAKQREALGLMHDQLLRTKGPTLAPDYPRIRLVPDDVPWVAEAIKAASHAGPLQPTAGVTPPPATRAGDTLILVGAAGPYLLPCGGCLDTITTDPATWPIAILRDGVVLWARGMVHAGDAP